MIHYFHPKVLFYNDNVTCRPPTQIRKKIIKSWKLLSKNHWQQLHKKVTKIVNLTSEPVSYAEIDVKYALQNKK